MFELSQLRCFTTVATELNFRRAAERLNMTQPPLSRQIQILEHNLGVELFTRSTRSVALTAAGRAFFIEAQTLLERAQQAAISARRFAEGDIGSVTISFVGSAVYEFLPRVIAEARLKQPQVKISLTEMNTYQQHEALRARRIDLGIVRAPLFQPGYESECLVREPFVLAVPSSHRLAHADSVGSRSGWRAVPDVFALGVSTVQRTADRYVSLRTSCAGVCPMAWIVTDYSGTGQRWNGPGIGAALRNQCGVQGRRVS